MVSTSVQSFWVHSVIFTSRGRVHSLTYLSFDFNTIGWGSKKWSTWKWPTPTKLIQHTYFSDGGVLVLFSLVALLKRLTLPLCFSILLCLPTASSESPSLLRRLTWSTVTSHTQSASFSVLDDFYFLILSISNIPPTNWANVDRSRHLSGPSFLMYKMSMLD